MKDQAFRLVPGVKLARDCQALARASWARSSASAASRVIIRANARRWGMRATRPDVKASSVSPPVALPALSVIWIRPRLLCQANVVPAAKVPATARAVLGARLGPGRTVTTHEEPHGAVDAP